MIDFVEPQPDQSMLEALAQRRAEADGTVAIDYGLHMTIPTWHGAAQERLREAPAVVAAGCPTFKMYQAYAGMILDDVSLLRALTAVAEAGGRTVLHSETGPVLDVLRAEALAEGHTEPIWHAYTRPAQLEATAVQRAAELADLAGCPLFIFHVGCHESVEAISAARGRGIDISGETCPQYLLLTADEHLGGAQGELYICAPPLRDLDDQDALWQALAQDTLHVVSTDHCPWTRAEKTRPDFAQVPGGVPSIEARLSLVHHFGVNQGLLTPERWVQVCCTNPARWMGLTRKGRLAPGYDADIVIFDPDRERRDQPGVPARNGRLDAVRWFQCRRLAAHRPAARPGYCSGRTICWDAWRRALCETRGVRRAEPLVALSEPSHPGHRMPFAGAAGRSERRASDSAPSRKF